MQIDISVLSTDDLLEFIQKFSLQAARMVLMEIKGHQLSQELAECGDSASLTLKVAIDAQLDQLICTRREDVVFTLAMVEEYNSRPDRPMAIPEHVIEQVRQLATK